MPSKYEEKDPPALLLAIRCFCCVRLFPSLLPNSFNSAAEGQTRESRSLLFNTDKTKSRFREKKKGSARRTWSGEATRYQVDANVLLHLFIVFLHA